MSVVQLVQQKNILVTGGAGFIGSHLCDILVKQGNVICLDNLITGQIDNIEHLLHLSNFEFVKHDLIEPVDLESLPELKKFKIPFHGIQEIYHLACPTSHYENHAHQLATALTNGVGTKHILDLTVKYRAVFLFTSSEAVYGWPTDKDSTAPYHEEYWGYVNPLSTRSCYDEGKRYAESLIMVYRDEHKLDTRILRIFPTYGPRMNLRDSRMIPRLISEALNNQKMVIYGQPTDRTTLCYITDVIESITKMMKSELAGPINIGSENTVSLKEVGDKIKNLAGSTSEIAFEKESPFTHYRATPDITLARNKLGWFPVVPLDEGLRLTIDDMRGSQVVGLQDIKV